MREVEWETLKWIDWHNNRRPLGPIGYIPPAEAEEAFYANLNSLDMVAWSSNKPPFGKAGTVHFMPAGASHMKPLQQPGGPYIFPRTSFSKSARMPSSASTRFSRGFSSSIAFIGLIRDASVARQGYASLKGQWHHPMFTAQLGHRHTAFSLAQDRKDLSHRVSGRCRKYHALLCCLFRLCHILQTGNDCFRFNEARQRSLQRGRSPQCLHPSMNQ